MSKHRDDTIYLQDILKEIASIESFLKRGNRDEELIEHAVVRSLEIIGEAASLTSESFKNSFTQVPWRDMKDMRNVLIHHYFGIDFSRVWQVVDKELPIIKQQLQEILNSRK